MGSSQTAIMSLVPSVRWNGAKTLGISAGSDRSDHRAFSQLVSRHADRLRALAIRFTGNEADAEDILQETFWRAWCKAGSWDDDGKAAFSTWLYRTLVNQCIDLDRKRRVRAWFSLSDAKTEVDDVVGDTPDPESVTGARETLSLVRLDILNLPVRQRATLLLSVMEGRSNRDIALILKTSIGAVEQALVRARRKLRQEMQTRSISEMGEGKD